MAKTNKKPNIDQDDSKQPRKMRPIDIILFVIVVLLVLLFLFMDTFGEKEPNAFITVITNGFRGLLLG